MTEKEIEVTHEEVVTETETESVTFCDGCTEECTDGHVTLTNISRECLNGADKIEVRDVSPGAYVGGGFGTVYDPVDLERLVSNADEFHICSDCLYGLKEHGRTIDASLYEAPEEEHDGPRDIEWMRQTAYVGVMSAMAIVGVMMIFTGYPFIGVALSLYAVVSLFRD